MTSSSSRDQPPDAAAAGLALVRRYGLAALPLALVGLLPWPGVLLLCLLFAASAQSGSHSEKWRQARFLLGVLVASLAVVPGLWELFRGGAAGWERFSDLQTSYFLGLLGAVVLHWAAVLLEGGSLVGVLVVAGLGLVAPQPGLVLALAGGALSREGADDRSGVRENAEATRRYTRWVGTGLALLLALAFLLPRPALNSASVPQPGPQRSLPTGAPRAERPRPSAAQRGSGKVAANLTLDNRTRVPTPPLELALLLGGALLLALAYRLMNLRGEGRTRPTLLEWLLVLALLLNILLFVVMAQGPGTGPGSALPPTGPPAVAGPAGVAQDTEELPRTVPLLMDAMNLLVWLALALQALLLGVVVWAWRQRQEQASGAAEPGRLEGAGDSAPAASGHRVRAAYRNAQAALLEHGWARLDSETPDRYAARLAEVRPEFAPALTRLTALYGPVRYGGRVTEQDAGQAEQAARELAQLAARHPGQEPAFCEKRL